MRAVAVSLCLSVSAAAQQPLRVESGKEDASPLALTTRKLEVDQRHPFGFDGVYQLSRIDAFGRGQSMFMRVDGAVTAVFPRSVYNPTPEGMVSEIPPGTVFWIGPPPGLEEAPMQSLAETYLSLRQPDHPAPFIAAPPVVAINSLITDEAYRQRRVAALLTLAAQE